MKKKEALPNTFISLGVLFVVADFVAAAVRHYKRAAAGRLLAARTSDGVLNSGNMPLRLLPIITSDAPYAGSGPNQSQRPVPAPRQAGSFPLRFSAGDLFSWTHETHGLGGVSCAAQCAGTRAS